MSFFLSGQKNETIAKLEEFNPPVRSNFRQPPAK